MDCSMPGLTSLHYLLEFAQTYSLSQGCHPTISFSLAPFSCLQSFSSSGSFTMSQHFVSGGQSTGASASASVLPVNIQSWYPLGLNDLISLLSKGLSRIFSSTSLKALILGLSVFFRVQLSHLYMTTGKTIALTIQTFVYKMISAF